jgi:hypothetical protein
MRIPLLCLTAFFLCACAKSSNEFSLYFYPAGTGLEDNDWSTVANVNVATKGPGLFGGDAKSRIVVSFREKGAEPELVYTGEWSTTAIDTASGRWVSSTTFELELSTTVEENVTGKTILEIDWLDH